MAEIGDIVKYNSRINAVVVAKDQGHILIKCPNGVMLCTKDTLKVVEVFNAQTKLF